MVKLRMRFGMLGSHIQAGVVVIARRIILWHVLCDKTIGGGYVRGQEDISVANIATE